MPARMPDSAPDPSRIVILSPNWLGDAVMALPAIADVKRRFAAARVIVAARRAVAGMFHLAPSIDEVLPLEWNGRLLRQRALRTDLDALRRLSADAALLLPNSFASAWMVSRAGIPQRMGYARDWRARLLTRAVKPPGLSVHQSEYYQHLVRALDMAVTIASAIAIEERFLRERFGTMYDDYKRGATSVERAFSLERAMSD